VTLVTLLLLVSDAGDGRAERRARERRSKTRSRGKTRVTRIISPKKAIPPIFSICIRKKVFPHLFPSPFFDPGQCLMFDNVHGCCRRQDEQDQE
jgi:hypothetical protein